MEVNGADLHVGHRHCSDEFVHLYAAIGHVSSGYGPGEILGRDCAGRSGERYIRVGDAAPVRVGLPVLRNGQVAVFYFRVPSRIERVESGWPAHVNLKRAACIIKRPS